MDVPLGLLGTSACYPKTLCSVSLSNDDFPRTSNCSSLGQGPGASLIKNIAKIFISKSFWAARSFHTRVVPGVCQTVSDLLECEKALLNFLGRIKIALKLYAVELVDGYVLWSRRRRRRRRRGTGQDNRKKEGERCKNVNRLHYYTCDCHMGLFQDLMR